MTNQKHWAEAMITQSLTLADGRVVEVFLGGDPEGYPLVMHHGTPADATTFADWPDACKVRGIRLIRASRAGYTVSTRLAGRSVAHEDAGQPRRGDGPQVLAVVHTAVIGIVLQSGETNLAHARRAFDFPFDCFLGRLLGEATSALDVAHALHSRTMRIDSFRIVW
jgi:hypothetical protein